MEFIKCKIKDNKHVLNSCLIGFLIGFSIFFVLSESSKVFSARNDIESFDSIENITDKEKEGVYLKNFEEMSDIKTETHEVVTGDTLGKILQNLEIGATEINEIAKSLKGVFNIKALNPKRGDKAGDKIVIKTSFVVGEDLENPVKEVKELVIEKNPTYKIITKRTKDGFASEEIREEEIVEYVRKEGVVASGESLYIIGEKQKIPYGVLDQLEDLFSFTFDLDRAIQPGDSFKLMYQDKYTKNGQYLGSGDLVYAVLNIKGKDYHIYRYEKENGKVEYYNENGEGAVKALKKRPISTRISSYFGKRKHPILGYTKWHKGVDFAARTGTPIPAAGNGTIVFRGWKKGYGNYIKIKHNRTYSTAYAHLKSFKGGQKVGSSVKRGQVVGYVGSTGMSTGPHLHYEVMKNSKHINPLAMNLPSIKNLSGDNLEKFTTVKDKIDLQFAVLGKNFVDYALLSKAKDLTQSNIILDK